MGTSGNPAKRTHQLKAAKRTRQARAVDPGSPSAAVREGALAPGAPSGGMTGDYEVVDPLDLLEAAVAHRAIAEDDIGHAVAHCREVGYSWHLIGIVVGMTGEGARKRYGLE